MKPGLILQHGDAGPAGILGEWLAERGIEHEIHATWREPLPARPGAVRLDRVARLRAHAGRRRTRRTWVDAEIDFLRAALEADVPVLGPVLRRPGARHRGGRRGRSGRAGARSAGCEVDTDDPELVPPGPWLHYHYDQLEPPERGDDDRPLAGRAGGVHARPLARAAVSPRVDAGDRRRVGPPGRAADRREIDRAPRRRGCSAPPPRARARREAAVRRVVGTDLTCRSAQNGYIIQSPFVGPGEERS